MGEYFYARITRDTEKPLDPAEKYVIGYHPHGMIPIAANWFSNTSLWISLFPNIIPYTLTASIMHVAPLLRDITQYFGVEVTRPSFIAGLEKFKALCLVPGG